MAKKLCAAVRPMPLAGHTGEPAAEVTIYLGRLPIARTTFAQGLPASRGVQQFLQAGHRFTGLNGYDMALSQGQAAA
jgi:hypothetical protein